MAIGVEDIFILFIVDMQVFFVVILLTTSKIMLCLSQSVGYAIQALASLEANTEASRLIREIAQDSKVPAPYLTKLLQKLAQADLVTSKRGYKGGVSLKRAASTITLLEISEAIDGRKWLGRCLLGLEECSDARACPTHEFWKHARQQIEQKLRQTTLADVVAFEHERQTTYSKRKKKSTTTS